VTQLFTEPLLSSQGARRMNRQTARLPCCQSNTSNVCTVILKQQTVAR